VGEATTDGDVGEWGSEGVAGSSRARVGVGEI
jgi:hypothetical protein